MIFLRRSKDRGRSKLRWLDSKHTFSFSNYYDPQFMGVSALRVINDDRVIPGEGFSTHSHKDMEIISYVKKGTIEHKDSMGNIQCLPAGEFQLMSAGTGVTHSEYNPSFEEELEFLQIWILPNKKGVKPGYQQKEFEFNEGLNLVVSEKGDEGSLKIHQDMRLYHLNLPKDTNQTITLGSNRTLYIHMISGELIVFNETIFEGDGVAIIQENEIQLLANKTTDALIFDLP